MYILFENYKSFKSYFSQRFMLIGGKGTWVHCEIVFPELSNLRASAWLKQGIGFRSWQPVDPNFTEMYDLGSKNWEKVHDYFVQSQGNKYDVGGVIGMVYGLSALNNPEAKFCSEVCFDALAYSGILDKTNKSHSPLQLRRQLIELGYQKIKI